MGCVRERIAKEYQKAYHPYREDYDFRPVTTGPPPIIEYETVIEEYWKLYPYCNDCGSVDLIPGRLHRVESGDARFDVIIRTLLFASLSWIATFFAAKVLYSFTIEDAFGVGLAVFVIFWMPYKSGVFNRMIEKREEALQLLPLACSNCGQEFSINVPAACSVTDTDFTPYNPLNKSVNHNRQSKFHWPVSSHIFVKAEANGSRFIDTDNWKYDIVKIRRQG